MAAYLIVSVLAGLASLCVGVFAFDAGFSMAAVWYILGCWAGFGLLLMAVLVSWAARKHAPGRLQTAPGHI